MKNPGIKKEIFEAIKDYLNSYIDKNNKGMLSNYKINYKSSRCFCDNNIHIDYNKTIIYINDIPVLKMHYKYSNKKVNLSYKMLLPDLEMI